MQIDQSHTSTVSGMSSASLAVFPSYVGIVSIHLDISLEFCDYEISVSVEIH